MQQIIPDIKSASRESVYQLLALHAISAVRVHLSFLPSLSSPPLPLPLAFLPASLQCNVHVRHWCVTIMTSSSSFRQLIQSTSTPASSASVACFGSSIDAACRRFHFRVVMRFTHAQVSIASASSFADSHYRFASYS